MVNYSTEHLDEVFAALSDPTRRAMIERLSRGELTVSQLAEPFAMSAPAVSKHLRILEKAGIVSQRKEGRNRYCSLHPQAMSQAADWFTHWSQFWQSQFSQLERFLLEDDEDEEEEESKGD